jgi:hypothetical protein
MKARVGQSKKKKWAWASVPRPKSLSERGYRKTMARTDKTEVNGLEIEMQSVSIEWYFEFRTACKDGGDLDVRRYTDGLIKNMVTSPAELRNKGLRFFEERDDLGTAMEVRAALDRFLLKSRDYSEEFGDKKSEK